MVVLYSNHCPKCNVITKKLEAAKVDFKLVDDIDWLVANGFAELPMPVLEVDGERYLSMTDMNNKIAELKGN